MFLFDSDFVAYHRSSVSRCYYCLGQETFEKEILFLMCNVKMTAHPLVRILAWSKAVDCYEPTVKTMSTFWLLNG